MLKSSPPTQSDFDWQPLNQLAGEDPDFAVELLTMFLKDAENSLSLLESAIADQSCQRIEDAAHALRGASSNVGAIAMSLTAQQLEQSACRGDTANARSSLQMLYACCQRLRSELSARAH